MSSPSPAPGSSRANYSPPHPEDITEILPNLFLGSLPGAQNLELLHRKGITHIISVMVPGPATAHRETHTEEDDGFYRMIIPVQDWPDEELLTHFKGTNEFIDNARGTAGAGVLVHWSVMSTLNKSRYYSAFESPSRLQPAGRIAQRDHRRGILSVPPSERAFPALTHLFFPLLIPAFPSLVMASHPPTPTSPAAIAFLRARRPQVQPNSGFVDQLAMYGRCGCDLDLDLAQHRNAVEAWRAGRHRQWEGRVDKLQRMKRVKQRKGGAWRRLRGWATLMSRWVG